MYTREEVVKIINDYKNLCDYTERLTVDDVVEPPLQLDEHENVLVNTSYYCRGWEDFNRETVPIEYYSMTDEQIDADLKRRYEEACRQKREAERLQEEARLKLQEEQERRLLAELKSKYEMVESQEDNYI